MNRLALTIGNFIILVFCLKLVWWFFKFQLHRLFGFRFPKIHGKSHGRKPFVVQVHHDDAYYDLKKFKFEQKMKYKLEKHRINQSKRKNNGVINTGKLPDFLKVIK